MIFEKIGAITRVFQENVTVSIFLENLNASYAKLKNEHLIIDLSSFTKLTSDDVVKFSELSNKHSGTSRSFVLVTDNIGYDEVPEEIIVVPTLQEANDIIAMEEIERDLGF